MPLTCPICQCRLRLKKGSLKNNLAVKCPKCQNMLLYIDGRLERLPEVSSAPVLRAGLILPNQLLWLVDENCPFIVQEGALVRENRDYDFALIRKPSAYSLDNAKGRVRLNGDYPANALLSLGDTLEIKGLDMVYFDGLSFAAKAKRTEELVSSRITQEFNGREIAAGIWRKYKDQAQAPAAGECPIQAELVLKSEEGDAGRFELPQDKQTVIGRGFTDISIMDPRLSKKHASVAYDALNGHWILTDLHSTNGTFLNGKQVQKAVLQVGDVLQLGASFFVFKRS